jgi:hypothetical protein
VEGEEMEQEAVAAAANRPPELMPFEGKLEKVHRGGFLDLPRWLSMVRQNEPAGILDQHATTNQSGDASDGLCFQDVR